MKEIEAKVRIKKEDINRIRRYLDAHYQFIDKVKKTDYYFEAGKRYTIRLRITKNGNIITLKKKKIGEGIEENSELEWAVKDASKWMKENKLKPKWTKKKKSEKYKGGGGVILELNDVKYLGTFLEIEGESKKQIIQTFQRFGYSKKDFVMHYYLELLKDKARYA